MKKKYILLFLILILSAQYVCAESITDIYISDSFDTVQNYAFDNSNENFTVIIDNEFGNEAPSRRITAGKRIICNISEIRNKDSGVIVAEADFCLQQMSDNRKYVLNIFDSDGKVQAAGVCSERNYLYIDCFDENGIRQILPIGTYFPGEWFNFAYSVNLADREIKLYLDGDRILFDSKIYVSDVAENLCRFLSVDRRSGTGDMWIDNIVIYRDDFDIGVDDKYESEDSVILPVTDISGNEIVWDKADLQNGILRLRASIEKYDQARTYFMPCTGFGIFGRGIFENEYIADVYGSGGEQITAVVASYSCDGKLRSVQIANEILTNGFNDLKVLSSDTEAEYYKCFLWSRDSIKPLVEPVFKVGTKK